MRRTPIVRAITRGAVVLTAAGIASTAFVGASSATELAPTIDTYSTWDGTSYIQPFGQPDTSTYGQTVTIPDGKKKLKWVSFWMAGNSGTGDIITRGEIYTWDGSKAGTLVSESKKKVVHSDASDPTAYKVKYKFKKAKVTPGAQYVFFASVSKDYEATDPGVLNQWAAHFADALPGGDFVFLNDGGDESQWTTMPWSVFAGFDLAFQAKLK